MIILSIHPGHNATVCLIRDGEIIGLLSQEKIDNVKNSASFPIRATEQLLQECDLLVSDIDKIAIAGNEVFPASAYNYLFNSKNEIVHNSKTIKFAKAVEQSPLGKVFPSVFRAAKNYRASSLLRQGQIELNALLDASVLKEIPRIHIDHHECHAFAAYYSLSYDTEPALIFTADGSGDQLSATVWKVVDGIAEKIAETPANASLGGIYSNTTRFLGMKILEHEYKVMGLAPYCKSYFMDTYERIFSNVIELNPKNKLTFKASIDTSKFYDYLVQNAVGERFDNIAGAVQYLLEDLVVKWIESAISETGIRNIYTGGGVFMNVKLNKRIQEMNSVKRVNFLPSCGDESNPIGAAYSLAIREKTTVKPIKDLYLGTSYSNPELHEFLLTNNYCSDFCISEPEDMQKEIAHLLHAGEVVARFSGRCEWGARSLGNRAILAHPSRMESFYTVNDLIKSRDFWMPFAPTILDTHAHRYLKNYNPDKAAAPYMITAFDATAEGVNKLRAALHQGDHTLRPQILTEEANPEYYAILKYFEGLSGVGGVLNTSLNLHGYPLVATPAQAMETLQNSGLRFLALGSFLVKKKTEEIDS